ncbi:NAD(P)H-binding protein [Sinomicrobium soli]|uniref:NAD(P)H-binding protein n=1 Tax=Sinomicrobium sp. N-1-3-6 TaxID=2219864 RepID=UPI000DCD0A15|nr:NAD(P)H-binding protein [Sinomicrobium sp. N-1-3-6]RAV30424.1 SDR family NAD(P)-dependent oxidoreductase [Sinomicrobium sp. N-1-3-6]
MKIAILGCGWLGLPLGSVLHQKGDTVNGSVTSPEKTGDLVRKGIVPFVIRVSRNGIEGPFSDFMRSADVLIIALPPRLRKAESGSFVQKISTVLEALDENGTDKILFISSTSVYADNNTTVTEHTRPEPERESGKQLLACETLIRNYSNRATILRFGGLIAEDRQPVYHLSGKTGIPNGMAPVNLIHRDDCIGIIREILRQEQWGMTFNATYPRHPSRKAYYTEKAIELGLVPPDFSGSTTVRGKIISPAYLSDTLQYEFQRDI